MNEDQVKRLRTAIYRFRDMGTFRDASRDGTRKMDAKGWAEFLATFCEIEREIGVDCGMTTIDRDGVLRERKL